MQRKCSQLLHINHIPDHLKDNEFVLTGWRQESNVWHALKSMFEWHNETLNIWTHFIGFIYFACMLYRSYSDWPVLIYNIGCINICFISTAFHTLCCCSKQVYYLFRTLDFVGIIFVMWSMFMPFIRYFQEPWFQVYLILSCVTSASSTIIALLPKFQTNEFHQIRVLVFALNGILGSVALVHLYMLYSHLETSCVLAGLAITSHAIGALFYASKFPERSFANEHVFHYVQGHTFFHTFVLIGFIVYFEACVHVNRVN